jgi:acid stress chaperone HdeA
MKLFFVSTMVLFSIPAFAINLKDPKCSELTTMKESVTPEYLAVIDGYDKAGKKLGEEVDVEGIVTDAKQVNEKCAGNKSAKIHEVRQDIRKSQSATASKTTLNPKTAKCQDFLAMSEEIQPVAAYWVAGQTKSGKARTGDIDEVFLERPVATLVEDCKAQPKASFYDRTKTWLKKTL